MSEEKNIHAKTILKRRKELANKSSIISSGQKSLSENSARKKPSIKKPILIKGDVNKTVAKKAASKIEKENYLTKRILKSAASTGFTQAAARTMRIMGQNVVVRNGWVVRVFADGKIEKISKLENSNIPLALD